MEAWQLITDAPVLPFAGEIEIGNNLRAPWDSANPHSLFRPLDYFADIRHRVLRRKSEIHPLLPSLALQLFQHARLVSRRFLFRAQFRTTGEAQQIHEPGTGTGSQLRDRKFK